jgi:hydroxymethylglutaryl-CoA lyase
MESVKLIECPRDAWQGLPQVIPAEEKVAYHRALIAAGFRHLDAVSFVSPKYVPQMADSEQVMQLLHSDSSLVTRNSPVPSEAEGLLEIIGIVVNEMGMERALATPGVTTLGYPYSISAHFRQANARMTRAESRALLERLRAATKAVGRQLVVYISMAFGNNYGEPWGPELIEDTLIWLKDIGVRTVSLADTIGTASPELVGSIYGEVKHCVAGIELGVHLHSRPYGAAEKVLAAYEAGCRRFDSVLTGLGGCPFAGDDLIGNIPTEIIIHALTTKGADTGVAPQSLEPVLAFTREIRSKYAH